MTREDIMSEYEIDSNGIIRSPGKFESEMLYVPYFWDLVLDGSGDNHTDGLDEGPIETSFDISPEDRAMFPELGETKHIVLWESDIGFVFCTEYENTKEFKRSILGKL